MFGGAATPVVGGEGTVTLGIPCTLALFHDDPHVELCCTSLTVNYCVLQVEIFLRSERAGLQRAAGFGRVFGFNRGDKREDTFS